MRKISLLLLFLVMNFNLFPKDELYEFDESVLDQDTQFEMNNAAYEEYKRADKKLNDYYTRIFELYKDFPNFLNKLKIAQRLWIQFRDAHIESVFPKIEGIRDPYGTSYSMYYSMELTKITWARVVELKSFIDEETSKNRGIGIRGYYKYDFRKD